MIKDYLIERRKLVLHVYGRIVIYADVNGKVHQGIVDHFTYDENAVWVGE
jgi:hypothetical protein